MGGRQTEKGERQGKREQMTRGKGRRKRDGGGGGGKEKKIESEKKIKKLLVIKTRGGFLQARSKRTATTLKSDK